MGIKWNEIFVGGDPLLVGSQIAIVLTVVAIVVGLTYFKNGVGYGANGLRQLTIKNWDYVHFIRCTHVFRGGIDGLLMKAQTARPEMNF